MTQACDGTGLILSPPGGRALTITDRGALLALTTLKNYDNYTFTHMVNVSILTMGQARALGVAVDIGSTTIAATLPTCTTRPCALAADSIQSPSRTARVRPKNEGSTRSRPSANAYR